MAKFIQFGVLYREYTVNMFIIESLISTIPLKIIEMMNSRVQSVATAISLVTN